MMSKVPSANKVEAASQDFLGPRRKFSDLLLIAETAVLARMYPGMRRFLSERGLHVNLIFVE
jgi:hypothetical protein